jgi:hypothetical protein
MIVTNGKDIINVRHPYYSGMRASWDKWRLVYRGGDDFNNAYIKQFSNFEDANDFKKRKEASPSPSFAKSVVNEVKNSIFQRMAEITRKGGPKSYEVAVEGQNFGVDLHGTDMNTFMGKEVLPELLTMAKVGIWVDMPSITGPTLVDAKGKTPYLYVYKAEEILSWTYRKDRIQEFSAVLLVDYIDSCEAFTGLPTGQWKRHRLCWIDPATGIVWCRMFNENGEQIDLDGNLSTADFKIDLPYIPFITLELTDSLLADVANHQIALTNLESSDMAYTLKSNFPIYTEQTDDRDFSNYLKDAAGPADTAEGANVPLRNEKDIKVGNSVGRRYRDGLERPGFIHPSSEPVQISMNKQAALKEDIRKLVNLSLSSIQSKMASAESKSIDMQGLESGLSYIGLELQRGERQIARIWSDYEKASEPAVIAYPKKWGLESEEDRRNDAKQLEELRDAVPSETFQKLISSKIVGKMIGDEISVDIRQKIDSEIKNAKSTTANPDIILQAVINGICDLELAATILGFPADSPQKAALEHAARLARIAASQQQGPAGSAKAAGARGVGDQSGQPAQDAAGEKAASRDVTQSASTEDKTRGQGK